MYTLIFNIYSYTHSNAFIINLNIHSEFKLIYIYICIYKNKNEEMAKNYSVIFLLFEFCSLNFLI